MLEEREEVRLPIWQVIVEGQEVVEFHSEQQALTYQAMLPWQGLSGQVLVVLA